MLPYAIFRLTAIVAMRQHIRMTIRARLTKMTRHEAAQKCGVSAPFVSQILRRRRGISTETLARISAAFGLEDAEIGASVRELHPDAFATPDQDPSAAAQLETIARRGAA